MADHQAHRNDEHLDEALLSAFLDGRIEDAEAARAHLSVCAECRSALAELRTVVQLLGDLPEPALPRSFALTPDQVPVRIVAAEPWFVRLQPALRWTATAAALVLVLVVTADLVVHRATPESGAVRSFSSAAGEVATAPAPAALESRSSSGAAAQPGTLAPNVQPSSPTAGAAVGITAAPPAASPAVKPSTVQPAAGSPASGAPSDSGAATPATRESLPLTVAEQAPRAGPSAWRLVELSLALIILWLLVAAAVLPRLRRPAG